MRLPVDIERPVILTARSKRICRMCRRHNDGLVCICVYTRPYVCVCSLRLGGINRFTCIRLAPHPRSADAADLALQIHEYFVRYLAAEYIWRVVFINDDSVHTNVTEIQSAIN